MYDDVSRELVVARPDDEYAVRMAVTGFLAGYSGLTRDAYALDLRTFWRRLAVGQCLLVLRVEADRLVVVRDRPSRVSLFVASDGAAASSVGARQRISPSRSP